MPQLDISTFYTQRFWLITMFIVRYIVIGSKFLPRLSYIIKYRSQFHVERDWTITGFNYEISIYKEKIMDFLAIKRVIINLLKNYKERLEELNRAINETISTSNEECMEEVLDRKYNILRTILTI